MNADYPSVAAFLYREARLLDDRCWDEWLGCYARSAVFWMPAWDDDDALTQDPQSQLSLIYYPNRDGLEDRVQFVEITQCGLPRDGLERFDVHKERLERSAEGRPAHRVAEFPGEDARRGDRGSEYLSIARGCFELGHGIRNCGNLTCFGV